MANKRVRLTGITVRNSHYSQLSVFIFDVCCNLFYLVQSFSGKRGTEVLLPVLTLHLFYPIIFYIRENRATLEFFQLT